MTVRLIVHRFTVFESEDPDIWAASPLYDWEHSEMGQWVIDHSQGMPIWYRDGLDQQGHYQYRIEAEFDTEWATIFQLKYAHW